MGLVIYLDHNATTPILPEVLEAMMPYLTTDIALFRGLQGPPERRSSRRGFLRVWSWPCRGTDDLARQARSISRHQRDDGKGKRTSGR